jgi:peptide deformylase
VTVRFLNDAGAIEDRRFEGMWAASVQHQIDHLEGRMFIDHLSPLRRKMLVARSDKLRKRG